MTSSDSLSVGLDFCGTSVHGNGKEKCRYICVREYKSGLPRCGGHLYKLVSLKCTDFFFFLYSIISIWVTGRKFVPG